MLQDFLERLCEELDIALGPKTQRKNVYSFRIADGFEAELVDLKPGFAAKGKLSLCPDKRREKLFIHFMRSNLLLEGTANRDLMNARKANGRGRALPGASSQYRTGGRMGDRKRSRGRHVCR